MQEGAEGGARKRWPSLSLPRPPLPTLSLLDGLERDSNHAATPSSDVSATLSLRKKKSRRGETAQKARKNEHDGRRARDHRSENPSLLPYQHVAVGAAPVVRQLEQGAQHPLVLVANRHPRHFGGKNMRGSARAKQKTERASSAPTMGPASKAKKKE